MTDNLHEATKLFSRSLSLSLYLSRGTFTASAAAAEMTAATASGVAPFGSISQRSDSSFLSLPVESVSLSVLNLRCIICITGYLLRVHVYSQTRT